MSVSRDRKTVQANVILSVKKGAIPMDVRALLADLDPLKILVEYDDTYQTFAAYCLDTGAVATAADSGEQALAILREILQNDILIAIRTNSLENFLRSSAPGDV